MANYCLFVAAFLFLALKTNLSLASPNRFLSSCEPSGILQSKTDQHCDQSNGAECCQAHKSYYQYKCSPPVTARTSATLTLNCFEKDCDGGGPSSCTNSYHSDNQPIVALSTGWFDHSKRCGKKIKIMAKNGKSVLATVVDECDSVNGCDKDHDNQPPCHNNIVDGSKAVWKALGLNMDLGEVSITWSDA
ncbi:hypothetical protein LUZ60_014531 [Juncus effusus]|nr:hypothetical protein LUZ60_014531 [Juncus effusus]